MKLLIFSSLLFASLVSSAAAPIACACKINNCLPGQVCVGVPGSKPCRTVCVFPESCGGIAPFPCEGVDSFQCVDDPRDDCDPAHGGSDCPGICIPRDA